MEGTVHPLLRLGTKQGPTQRLGELALSKAPPSAGEDTVAPVPSGGSGAQLQRAPNLPAGLGVVVGLRRF